MNIFLQQLQCHGSEEQAVLLIQLKCFLQSKHQSKAVLSVYILGAEVYFSCNPPWGTPVAEQNHCRNVCFLLCQCNFCSLPSVFGPTSESSLHVLLLNVREICFTKKTWIWVFKGFLALDKNGWFALRSAHCGSELKQTGWNKRWFFYVHTRTGSYCVLLSCRSALLHLSHLFLSPLAVREPW